MRQGRRPDSFNVPAVACRPGVSPERPALPGKPLLMTGYCPVCRRPRLFHKERAAHPVHLALTVLTRGRWGVVWVALALHRAGRRPRCVTCGSAPSGPPR